MHPRNRHQGRYDFDALIAAHPALAAFVTPNAHGDRSVDFAAPEAVKALNRALLKSHYGITGWDIPPGFLCPPIPGRADYVHHLADLLAEDAGGDIPRGSGVRALDIGVGANAVYPLIGHGEYGWSFVGSDISREALDSAGSILAANPGAADAIELRLQRDRARLLSGILTPGEHFDVVMCNPPFHASADDARDGSRRKWRNLGKGGALAKPPALNFGGRAEELWCAGGEAAFVSRLVEESVEHAATATWFTSLVAKSENLPAIRAALRRAAPVEWRLVDMAQGAKKSRFVAWTFVEPASRRRHK